MGTAPYYQISDELARAAEARLIVAQQMMNEMNELHANKGSKSAPEATSKKRSAGAISMELFAEDKIWAACVEQPAVAKAKIKEGDALTMLSAEPANKEAPALEREQLSLLDWGGVSEPKRRRWA
ncbi:MAG: hypothetical protein ACLP29_00730 [Dissulfurispiraceae bacterium]